MSGRRILLLEPNYKNKYPPLGLMKLAMYHRLQGDDVVFWKGDFSEFILNELTRDAINQFKEIDLECKNSSENNLFEFELSCKPYESIINWDGLFLQIKNTIKSGTIVPESALDRALVVQPLAKNWLESLRKQYRTGGYFSQPRWDRVCITTLFTFYWDITIETIEFAKKICKDPAQVFVGGILASVVPAALEKTTGIRPHVGPLNIPRYPGDSPLPAPFKTTVIDELPLDYSILEEIDYRYPAADAFYAYATRGCVNKCAFCAVPIIEPDYCDYIPLKKRLNKTRERFGEQRHLLLLDNNVFASDKFDKIIDEIHDSGFAKGATYIPSNQLDIAINQLRKGWNDRAYIRLATRLLNAFVEKLEDEQSHDRFYALLLNHGLLHGDTATKDKIFIVYEEIKDSYEKARSKKALVRFIDFNQGMDARLATPQKMAKLSTIAIRPLRIAFDSWAERKYYVNAIKLAKENGITQLSNYLLYNFKDKPVDLYRRLLLNIDLCENLEVNIYSFPMKYHPIMDPQWFSNRDYIGEHWTRKAIRTVQAVLNSTHGKIGRGRTFFFKAFGRNEEEFETLIRMPEAFIIRRWDAEISGLLAQWHDAYIKLTKSEQKFVDNIVAHNVFLESDWKDQSMSVRDFLCFYLMHQEDIPSIDHSLKNSYMDAFEKSCSFDISEECRNLLKD